ncbi:hypothetical protein LguiB_019840 [Lonicera macranthoides]
MILRGPLTRPTSKTHEKPTMYYYFGCYNMELKILRSLLMGHKRNLPFLVHSFNNKRIFKDPSIFSVFSLNTPPLPLPLPLCPP